MKSFNTWCYFDTTKILPHQLRLDEESAILLVDYGSNCEPMNYTFTNGKTYGIEILTNSIEKASRVADILCACNTVVKGYNNENPEDIIRRFSKNSSDLLSQVGAKGIVYGDDSMFFACKLLQKAYGHQNFENAVCKYHVAHEVYSLHPMDLHPLEDPFINEYLLSERIRIANVIVECYSVLEELHTQIIASPDKPSVFEDGKWNPDVKDDLCGRLKANHIDPCSSIPWLTRNGVIRPFKTNTVKHDVLCEWSDGSEVSDFNINICDAILELSFMRSHLASHKLNEKVMNLTVYDAENAFALARYILLSFFDIDLFCNDNFV